MARIHIVEFAVDVAIEILGHRKKNTKTTYAKHMEFLTRKSPSMMVQINQNLLRTVTIIMSII